MDQDNRMHTSAICVDTVDHCDIVLVSECIECSAEVLIGDNDQDYFET